jgi:hypothetical protein
LACRPGRPRSGNWVLDIHYKDAVDLVLGGECEHVEGTKSLAEAFVVEEVEKLVFGDGTAEVQAELVAVEGGLLEGNADSGVADQQRLEEAGGVQVCIAQKLVECGVEAVGAAGRSDVDRRPR